MSWWKRKELSIILFNLSDKVERYKGPFVGEDVSIFKYKL